MQYCFIFLGQFCKQDAYLVSWHILCTLYSSRTKSEIQFKVVEAGSLNKGESWSVVLRTQGKVNPGNSMVTSSVTADWWELVERPDTLLRMKPHTHTAATSSRELCWYCSQKLSGRSCQQNHRTKTTVCSAPKNDTALLEDIVFPLPKCFSSAVLLKLKTPTEYLSSVCLHIYITTRFWIVVLLQDTYILYIIYLYLVWGVLNHPFVIFKQNLIFSECV